MTTPADSLQATANGRAAVQEFLHGTRKPATDHMGRLLTEPSAPAGEYEIVAVVWNELTSGPDEPKQYRRHYRGQVVHLEAPDAARLLRTGAVRPTAT
jgi:hypothetical protein